MSVSGIALIDKPKGFTSHDAVAKLRGVLGTRKVGHAGTLDPMATGLLVIGVGSGTKLMTYLSGSNKSYQATVRLGQTTFTDDAEGEVIAQAEQSELDSLTPEEIKTVINSFLGKQQQVPSRVSAKKIDGKRAYDLAREGEEFELKAVEVEISRIESSQPKFNQLIDVDIAVDCSSGTFIRAIARDLGEKLGVGAHLTALRRTKVGDFSIDQATAIDEAAPMSMVEAAKKILPIIEIDNSQETELSFGRQLEIESDSEFLAAVNGDKLVAIVSGGKKISPKTVFNG
ncbi:MAG: tRNA pseudouridine(55) synthase TruB [Microbacteriaceae bacterium]|nr:tRNA pseudouridine(55) synthase TruB [Microbacteriaceae bacterium]MDR9443754.1 tRNA pseudouridine(55) synthase TruB [Microbacteriaceae bacterium]